MSQLQKGQKIKLSDGIYKLICFDNEYHVFVKISKIKDGERANFNKVAIFSSLPEHTDLLADKLIS